MLKACLDCLTGNKTGNEESYGTQLNERTVGSPAPLWPGSKTENKITMNIPKQLQVGDRFSINGKLTTNRKWMKLSLMTGNYGPDETNVPLEIDVQFQSMEEYSDQIHLKSIVNGAEEYLKDKNSPESGFFSGGEFEVNVLVMNEELLGVYVSSSLVDHIKLRHRIEDIRYIVLAGDVEKVDKLEFVFA